MTTRFDQILVEEYFKPPRDGWEQGFNHGLRRAVRRCNELAALSESLSDEDLVKILQRARSIHHFGTAEGIADSDPHWLAGMVVGVRAVREALAVQGAER